MPEARSGLSAEELFVRGEEITYDDFTILNTQFSETCKRRVSLRTNLGKGVLLEVPIMASPMDSVTSPRLAIAIAQLGGIAVIHYNHKDADGRPSIDEQIADIARVKRSQNGFIEDPLVVEPDMSIEYAIELGKKDREPEETISTFPVTENGQSHGRLVGLLRRDDYLLGFRTGLQVRERMLGIDKLIVGNSTMSLKQARKMIWDNHIRSLPIVNEEGNLVYLVTRGDMEKSEQFPQTTMDEKGRLRVLFAVSTWPESYERVERGFAAGADGVVVDTSQGFGKHPFEMLRYIAGKHPDKLLIGGNISTSEAALALARLDFVDAYRCGQGSGSICTTADAIGIGRAGATAIYECARAVHKSESKMVTIADGGIRFAGDITKALALRAGAVMVGSMLAGSDECPGKKKLDERGRKIMEYWGMGSKKANVGGEVRVRDYGAHEEGIVKQVPYKGKLKEHLPEVVDALLHSFEVLNCGSISDLHQGTKNGDVRFGKRGLASIMESRPHG
ncbi:MAG TPA: IMP dehydrogenase [Candidatus Nanoarchaeia archaeon]|nr:IMP dehydrogenase [Candidatus Nanoarchaeia archaeon]